MADRLCLFVCQRHSGDSPPIALAVDISNRLVTPAIQNFDFALETLGYEHEPGSISDLLLEEVQDASLVIADLTELSSSGYFQLGARRQQGLPTVFICDQEYQMPLDVQGFHLVRYTTDNPPDVAQIKALEEAIQHALTDERVNVPPTLLPPLAPREMRLEFAHRIEATAEVIRALRLNSVGDSVAQLVAIADDLKNLPDDDANPTRIQEAADKALKVIFSILDELSTQSGARMAITGAISLIVGGTGASGAAAFSAGLAFWYGKDVFTKLINTWGTRNAPKRTKRK